MSLKSLVSVDNFLDLSPEERYEELKYRYLYKDWSGFTHEKRKPFENQFIREKFKSGELISKVLSIIEIDLSSSKKRKEAKEKISLLRKELINDRPFLKSLYYLIEGNIYYWNDKYEDALNSYQNAMEPLAEFERIPILFAYSNSYMWAGNFEKAIKLALKYNELIEKYKFVNWRANNLELLAQIYQRTGDYALSADFQYEALEIYQAENEYQLQVRVLNAIYNNKRALGLFEESIEYLLKAEALFDKSGINEYWKSIIYFNLLSERTREKNFASAEDYAKKAIRVAEEGNLVERLIEIRIAVSSLKNSLKKHNEALTILKKLDVIDEKYWRPISRGRYYEVLATTYFHLEDYDKVKPLIEKAIAITKKYDMTYNLLPQLNLAYSLSVATKNLEDTVKYITQYYELKLKIESEKNSKLLYARENKNLQLKNHQNELILENQKTKTLMLGGFVFAFFLIVVLQFNRNQVIKKKERIVREKTHDLQGVLDNIPLGVVTLNLKAGRKIRLHNTSLYFYSIFKDLTIEDSNIGDPIDYLFEKSSLNNEDIAKIRSVIISSTEEPLWQWEINEVNLPREMTLQAGQQILEIDWAAVQYNDVVKKIVITFKDVTEIRQLGAQQEQNEINIQKLIALSLMEQKEYFIFIHAIEKMIDENLDIIDSRDEYLKDAIDIAFRNLHTIKGLARTYNLMTLSGFIHDIETFFQKTRNGEIEYDKDQCLIKLKEARDEIESYKYLARTKLKWDDELPIVSLAVKKLTDWYKTISEVNLGLDNNKKLDILLKDMKKRYSTTLKDALKNIIMNNQKLSREMNKGEVDFTLEGCEIFISSKYQDKIGSIFVHLIRNSIDHGFVTVGEREKLKLDPPKIQISLEISNDNFCVKLSDNGRGLHLPSLLKKSQEAGSHIDETNELDLANTIFNPGLSTKTEVSDISGRGVGMDAVRDLLENLGGGIRIRPVGPSRDGYLPILFELDLPKTFFDI